MQNWSRLPGSSHVVNNFSNVLAENRRSDEQHAVPVCCHFPQAPALARGYVSKRQRCAGTIIRQENVNDEELQVELPSFL